MTDPRLRVERVGATRTLILDAPDRLNALDFALLDALAEAVEAPADGDRVVVLRGAGRAFSAGADLVAAADLAAGAGGATIDAAERVVRAILASPLPVIASVHGPCAGVGVPIALAADLVVAAEPAFFQLAFTRIALMPDGGASALVAASCGRAVAMRMALLAERVSAAEALATGLIARVVPTPELDAEVAELAARLSAGPAAAFAATKRSMNAAALGTLDAAFQLERAGQTALLGAGDFAEGVSAFTEKRAPRFQDRAT